MLTKLFSVPWTVPEIFAKNQIHFSTPCISKAMHFRRQVNRNSFSYIYYETPCSQLSFQIFNRLNGIIIVGMVILSIWATIEIVFAQDLFGVPYRIENQDVWSWNNFLVRWTLNKNDPCANSDSRNVNYAKIKFTACKIKFIY